MEFHRTHISDRVLTTASGTRIIQPLVPQQTIRKIELQLLQACVAENLT